MRRYPLHVLAAAALLAACGAPPPPSLQTLIDKNAEARGGADAIESIRSLRLSLQISEPGFTVRGTYAATRAGDARVDIYIGDQRVFTEALGPDGGWQMKTGEPPAVGLSEAGEGALQRGRISNLYGLHELGRFGYDLTLVGESSRDGETYWEIEVADPDGFRQRLFMDKETYLVERRIEVSALHPDQDPTKAEFETRYSDFRDTDGVLLSRVADKIDLATGKVVQSAAVQQVEINPALDRALFERPGD